MIRHITIQQLLEVPGIVCLESDFAFCHKLSDIPYFGESFRSNLLMVFYCTKGSVVLNVENRKTTLVKGDAYICKPLTTICEIDAYENSLVSILFFSPDMIDKILPVNQNLSHVIERDFDPVVHFGKEVFAARVRPLLDMLCHNDRSIGKPFHNNMRFHLICLLLFEVLNGTFKTFISPEAGEEHQYSCRADSLFHLFIKLLKEDGGHNRMVSYYADKLCVSPKYLSKIIKQKTGMRTIEVINRHAMQQIKMDLKLTDIPISQLAMKYEFNNFSFFCQYVKSHLGMTPQDFREHVNSQE